MSKRTLTNTEKGRKYQRVKSLNEQNKKAATRAKYGPSGKPSLVTIKRLVDGAVVEVCDQAKITRQWSRR